MEPKHRPRKACDLCYDRKLKCDRRKPNCSNCVTYGTECTHTAPSRRSTTKVLRNEAGKSSEEIQRLKEEIEQLKAHIAQDSEPSPSDHQPQNLGSSTKGAGFIDLQSEDGSITEGIQLSLPPLQQVLPRIASFLNNLNSVLPLFHPKTLLGLVGECYSLPPHQRNPVDWAAINVVIALSIQQVPTGENPGNSRELATQYLNKAQSVITTVMLGQVRLLNIQVLVGMVMLLQSLHDLTPSLILISATMRLAHKMGLQSRASSAHLDQAQQIQYARVFWLAYILDKTISLRARQPSIQQDDDIDLDLPPLEPIKDEESGAGIIATVNGSSRINYFVARVQLASIEGAVYDYLYSTRAMNRSPEARAAAKESVHAALEKWKRVIPSDFCASALASNTVNNPTHMNLFCMLHAASLSCTTLINQAHAWNEQWMSALQRHGKGMQYLQLPDDWMDVVKQSRSFMILFQKTWSIDLWCRWITSCTYVSSMAILLADTLHDLQHDNVNFDTQLINTALGWLEDTLDEISTPGIREFHDVCVEIAKEVQRRRAESAIIVQGTGISLEYF